MVDNDLEMAMDDLGDLRKDHTDPKLLQDALSTHPTRFYPFAVDGATTSEKATVVNAALIVLRHVSRWGIPGEEWTWPYGKTTDANM